MNEKEINKQIKELKIEMRNAHPIKRFMLIPQLRKLCEIRDELIRKRVSSNVGGL